MKSKNEYDMMTRSVRQPYTSFTIHKYLYNIDNKNECLMHTVYGYDPENEVLVDIEDDTNICNIERKELNSDSSLVLSLSAPTITVFIKLKSLFFIFFSFIIPTKADGTVTI